MENTGGVPNQKANVTSAEPFTNLKQGDICIEDSGNGGRVTGIRAGNRRLISRISY